METGGVRGLEQDAFLQLLTTQLQYQDPLSPMENVEFVAQLAMFSQLEQMTEMRKILESSSTQLDSLGYYNAASLIGKDVQAEGKTILFDGSPSTPVSYRLHEDADQVTILISDPVGNPVRAIRPGPQGAGFYTVDWDGKDQSGNMQPKGNYTVEVVATDSFGVRQGNSTFTQGEITGVSFEDGVVYLTVNGEKLPAADVLKITSRVNG